MVQKPRNITKHMGSEIWLANVGEAGVSLRLVGTNARRNGGSRLCISMQIVGANAPVQSDDMPKSIFGCISPRPCRKNMKVLSLDSRNHHLNRSKIDGLRIWKHIPLVGNDVFFVSKRLKSECMLCSFGLQATLVNTRKVSETTPSLKGRIGDGSFGSTEITIKSCK